MKRMICTIATALLLLSLSSCNSSSVQNENFSQDDKYKIALERSSNESLKNDEDKNTGMRLYKQVGGFNESKKRALAHCKNLREGETVEGLIYKQDPTKPAADLNYKLPLSDQQWYEIKILNEIYLTEISAAHDAYCPETQVEKKFTVE